ncbi:MAG: hypothetical protein SO434_00820 [Eubacteriales bacterium]|nr:hypothetical protein [Eubacteriales bacterium]
MEKFIIVAGSPNSGKTLSVNMLIKKVLSKGATIEKYLFGSSTNFWNTRSGGAIIVSFNSKRIAIISYGDTVYSVNEALTNSDVLSCNIIICCSHATRGKKVFNYFHDYIKKNNLLSTTQIVPIYKNLLCGLGNETLENDSTANLIVSLI